MFNGIKDFVADKFIKHLAENAKVNYATNMMSFGWLGYLVLQALTNNHIKVTLLMSCCDVINVGKAAPGSFLEMITAVGAILVAVMLWYSGKCPTLKKFIPIVQEVQADLEAEIQKGLPVGLGSTTGTGEAKGSDRR